MLLGQVPTTPGPEGLRRDERCVSWGIQINSNIHLLPPRRTAAVVGPGAGDNAEHLS